MVEGLFSFIAKGLKKHPEKLLLLGCIASVPVLTKSGINQWLACFTPFGLYIVYGIMRYVDGNQRIAIKELEIKKLESQAKQIQARRRKRNRS